MKFLIPSSIYLAIASFTSNPVEKDPKRKRARRNVRVPLLWRAIALAAMVLTEIVIFYVGVHRAGVALPLSEKNRDPIFFSFVFAVAIPALIYAIIRVVMINILLKKSAGEIGKEIARDVAVAVAVTVVDGLTGSSGSGGSRPGSTSPDETKGGGGSSGGGGASGSY